MLCCSVCFAVNSSGRSLAADFVSFNNNLFPFTQFFAQSLQPKNNIELSQYGYVFQKNNIELSQYGYVFSKNNIELPQYGYVFQKNNIELRRYDIEKSRN